MAESEKSMTELGDEAREGKRRGMFSRRKEQGEVRSDTEWVDTLVAHDEPDAEPLSGSPFAAGEDEPGLAEALPDVPEPAPELPEHDHAEGPLGLPEEAAETDDEVVLREKRLYRPDKLALENQVRAAHRHRGEDDAFYEKSWTRRTRDSMEDIHNFIDNIIGTDRDPSRRRQRTGAAAGLTANRSGRGDVESVRVDGLEEDLLIAFTFPKHEFRGARVVYETEGGYVVEVTRAIGGDDRHPETQYYTVSRVGEVGHVLDKLRANQVQRQVEAQRAAGPGSGFDEPTVAPVDEFAAQDPPTETAEPAPAAPATAPPETAPSAPAPEAGAAPEPAEDEGEKTGGRFGFLRKGKKEDDGAPATEEAPGAEAGSEEGGEEKSGGRFGFLRKGKKDTDDADGDDEARDQA